MMMVLGVIALGREVEFQDTEIRGEVVYVKGEEKGFTGLLRDYYENGNIREESEYKDGYRDGKSKEYTRDGNLREELEYKRGKIDGIRRMYYDSGKLEMYQEWKDDELHGISKHYFESGNIRYESTDIKGKKDGVIKFYYENGKVSSETEMKNGKSEGKYRSYYPNGNLEEEGRYKNNQRVGVWKEYDLTGELISERKYEYEEPKEIKTDGIELELNRQNSKYYKKGESTPYTGEKKTYNDEGEVKIVATYEDGVEVSNIYYDDYSKGIKSTEDLKKGDINERIMYDDGIITYHSIQNMKESYGEDREYSFEGILQKVNRYIGIYMKDRKPHGIQEEYYENGNLMKRVEYRNGNLHGIYEEYDEEGKLKIKGEYKNGEKVGEWKEY